MRTLTVDLGDRSYPIYIGSGIRHQKQLFRDAIHGKQVMIVTNTTVADIYLAELVALLGDEYQVDTCVLPDGEKYKTLATYEQNMSALLEAKHNRTTTVIALGGGVVGDMAGFAAATYQRGVPFIQVPTTLLSQVDSSVGGKTGVNHPLGKNMIGAFYQPQAVIIDTESLSSLPARELSAGMAEVIKYGLICNAPFFSWLEDNIDDLMTLDSEKITHAIYESCRAKAEVVAQDEKEGGIRAILNLGHTFGHAIETEMGYGNWLHGEAVAAGTVLAVDLSWRLGSLTESDVERSVNLLAKANLPVLPPKGMSREAFIERMLLDKKVLDGSLRLILLQALGDAYVTSDFAMEDFNACLDDAIEAASA